MTRILRPTALLFALSILPGLAAAAGLVLHDPWVREAPPMASMLAGYVTIENTGAKAEAIVSASSPAFGDVEIHRTIIKDGMARMIKQDRLVIPAHGKMVLAPGGYHLMMMMPKRPLHAGDTVEVTLSLENGQKITTTMPVRKANDGDGMHMNMPH